MPPGVSVAGRRVKARSRRSERSAVPPERSHSVDTVSRIAAPTLVSRSAVKVSSDTPGRSRSAALTLRRRCPVFRADGHAVTGLTRSTGGLPAPAPTHGSPAPTDEAPTRQTDGDWSAGRAWISPTTSSPSTSIRAKTVSSLDGKYRKKLRLVSSAGAGDVVNRCLIESPLGEQTQRDVGKLVAHGSSGPFTQATWTSLIHHAPQFTKHHRVSNLSLGDIDGSGVADDHPRSLGRP